jgi:hypothetical protein
LNALYDGCGEPIFAEPLPPARFADTDHCIVTFDRWQHPVWEGGGIDLILQIEETTEPLPPYYLDRLSTCLRCGGFIAVHGPDAEAVAEVVETITAAAEVTQ